jgi:pre-mRNA-splicing factor 18
MVGIHERTGRERISTNKVAHIMNNEMQRKYLTSVKRLMRFLQDKRPDVLPSKKVL